MRRSTISRWPKRLRLAAVLAGGLLLVGGLGWLGASLASRTTEQAESVSPGNSSEHAETAPDAAPGGAVVDESVRTLGAVPEPITRDPAAYGAAALLAPATFDTTKTTRAEFLQLIYPWMSPMPRPYGEETWTEDDRSRELASSKLVLAMQVLYPQREWDTLAEQKGRAVAALDGPVTVEGDLRYDTSHTKYWITGRVKVTYTAEGPNGEFSWDETADVQLTISCGDGSESAPVPGSSQRTGDCKVGHWVGH